NNDAVHLWMMGEQSEAQAIYLRMIGIDPADTAANLQLAQMALKERKGAEALRYLAHLPDNPKLLPMRLNAEYMAGDASAGDAVADKAAVAAAGDLDLTFAIGTTLFDARRFLKAESFFESALKFDPTNFNVLYDLGVAANEAGHYSRAAEVLAIALSQQPQNVDVLYAAAQADEGQKHFETSLQLLAKAGRISPRRADIQKTIAVTAAEAGALDDALSAWDRYLKLAPTDDIAIRERAYTIAKMGRFEEALAAVDLAVARHPNDILGHYELGQVERNFDTAKALAQFDKAIALNPKYVPALTARGNLYYQEGKPGLAVKDFELAVSLAPADAGGFDRLGQAYQALDKTSDAVRVLRKASELAPQDSKILLHFGRALADSGARDESKAVMDRFRQMDPEKKPGVPAGFVEYLSLSPEERRASFCARVEKTVREHPNDVPARVAWVKLLLEERKTTEAADAVRKVEALKPDAAVMKPLRLDLALALSRAGDAQGALAQLDEIAAANRDPDYYMTRAEVEGTTAPEKALAANRPDLYRRAASLLIAKGEKEEASKLLDRAPRDRSILLMKAALTGMPSAFLDIENQWPEWYPGWAAQGVVLAEQGQYAKALKPLETAVALGAREPEVYFYIAWCRSKEGLATKAAADRAVALSGETPDRWIQALARGEYEKPPYLERLIEGTLFY
ncbi:MAG TPA: tetratricopeptide repeat protein, partial [Bryobacteraceae bacterium]|nr:tetratricopeptide repeat protein [Bryobacteraceae bacterium]